MTLVALQPPDMFGLVARHHDGPVEGLTVCLHDRPGLGPFRGRSSPGLPVGVDADGPVRVLPGPVRRVPCVATVVETPVRARRLADASGIAAGADARPTPLGRLELEPDTGAAATRARRGRGGPCPALLAADDPERLADLLRRHADGARRRATWPITWVRWRAAGAVSGAATS